MLIPPGHDALLRHESVETSEFPLRTRLSTSELDWFDDGPFAGLRAERSTRRRLELRRAWAQKIQLEQRPGEVLLVPSDWAYHQSRFVPAPSTPQPVGGLGADGGDGDDLALHLRLVTFADHARVLREVARTQPRGSPLSRLVPSERLARLLERARKRTLEPLSMANIVLLISTSLEFTCKVLTFCALVYQYSLFKNLTLTTLNSILTDKNY